MTKKIADRKLGVSITNTGRMNRVLQEVNRNHTQHTADLEYIASVAREAEADLKDRGFSASGRVGTELEVTTPGPDRRQYKTAVIGSRFLLKRTQSGWSLKRIETVEVLPGSARKYLMSVTAEQRAALYRYSMMGLGVRDEEAANDNAVFDNAA